MTRRFQPIRNRIAKFRADATAALVTRGMPQEEADQVVGALGDGEILKLLLTNLDAILAFLKMVIDLFGE